MYQSIVCCVLLLVSLTGSPVAAQSQQKQTEQKQTASAPMDQAQRLQKLNQITSKGVSFLMEKGRDETDGSYSKQLSPAVTALCVSALVRNGVPVAHEKIQQSLAFLEAIVKPDGGIYAKGSHLRNYETSVSLIAFHQCNVDGKYDDLLDRAASFLKGIQWDEGEGHEADSRHYGGQGYGKHQRPDASNTSFFLDALKEIKTENNSVAISKAIAFMSRCQNLPTPHNDAEFAQVVGADDRGGFVYSAVGKGETKAESTSETPVGGLRSYASMTYAGLKSFLYAGIDKDDVRVQAALDWISRHYDLQSNPGVGQQGLFYYYHVFAKALDAYDQPTIKTADGQDHNWRSDLVKVLAEKQQADGSWTNPADRWYEGDPNLVTSYSLLALSYCDQ